MDQIAQDAWIGGWGGGGQPNLGNVCILGTHGPALPPLTADHHCSVWRCWPRLGLHHPAVLSDGEALDCLFNYVLIISLNSIQVYILGAGLVLASLLTIPPWGIYRLGRYHL